MGLAATEGSLQTEDTVPGIGVARQGTGHPGEHVSEAAGEIALSEESLGIQVNLSGFPLRYRPKIGGEDRLFQAALADIFMRNRYGIPWFLGSYLSRSQNLLGYKTVEKSVMLVSRMRCSIVALFPPYSRLIIALFPPNQEPNRPPTTPFRFDQTQVSQPGEMVAQSSFSYRCGKPTPDTSEGHARDTGQDM